VVRPRGEQNPEYFHYLLRTPAFAKEAERWSYGITSDQWSLCAADFKQIYCSLPPKEEQDAIVTLLGHADRCINRLIRAKRRLIELLNEQKQVIIHQAVTRGLDPNVRLKPSGIDWLGDVPEHWKEITVGNLTASLQTGPFGSQLHATDYAPGGTPVINPSHLRDGTIVPDTYCAVDEETRSRLSRHQLQLGDIVLARRGELGRCGLVHQAQVGWLCGTGSLRLRPKHGLFEPEYLLLILSSQGVRDTLKLSSVGSTMDNLNTGIVARRRIPQPPIEEQQAIVDYIGSEVNKTDSAVDRALREISLLREYHTRLIADVVTGKLDVRGLELPALDEAEVMEDMDTGKDAAVNEMSDNEEDLE
jgi:type I restriction enzyme S subunit